MKLTDQRRRGEPSPYAVTPGEPAGRFGLNLAQPTHPAHPKGDEAQTRDKANSTQTEHHTEHNRREHRMKRIIAAALLAAALTGTTAHATTKQEAKWSNYRDRKTGNEVVIKAVCLDAEDSAAHLKLKAFRDHGGHVVFGCYKHGY